jgi:WD40 repeat protein
VSKDSPGRSPPQRSSRQKKEEPKAERPEQAEPLTVLERKLTGHTGWVKSVAVSPDGKWAASGSNDETVKIWDLETGECRATLKGHTGAVFSMVLTPDGRRVLSGSTDKSVRVWDAKVPANRWQS